MFKNVLIANRGEIAVRIISTLKKLNIRSIVIYSEEDKYSNHVSLADIAIKIEGDRLSDTYLNINKIIQIAKDYKVQAIIPGYGFLSENYNFAKLCEKKGIVFIGPSSSQIEQFGLKHKAKSLAKEANVPLVPGSNLLNNLQDAIDEARKIGYPVMLKSTAGGGGIGLTKCEDEEILIKSFESVRKLGKNYFNDNGVFLESFINNARHIEVQIFGDGKGNVISLGERDCSLQRRNQKIIEITPAINITEDIRKSISEAAVNLGKKVKYKSAGTVEFIYDVERNKFYFLEVNTRLQVEHPITEMCTGVDLVEWMLKVACGDLNFLNKSIEFQGYSIEARIYAEEPAKNFQPSSGFLHQVKFPTVSNSIRVDTWIKSGIEISTLFDPMLAKVIVHSDTFEDAILKLRKALKDTTIIGIGTNIEYLDKIIQSDNFISSKITTKFLDSFKYCAEIIEILDPGTFTTIQDYPGRVGFWDIGVPPSGPMDDFAFRLLNRIVGNDSNSAGIEATLIAPTLKSHKDIIIAIGGGRCDAKIISYNSLGGYEITPAPIWEAFILKAGQILKIGKLIDGCRSYIAIRGGIDVPNYLGSRSTFVLGSFGGLSGRVLKAGDLIPLVSDEKFSSYLPRPISDINKIDINLIPKYSNHWDIFVLYGPHGSPDYFTNNFIKEFFDVTWKVHYNSNRLGVRLIGPNPTWSRLDGGEAGLHPSNIHDCVYAIGAINFTGDMPVILTNDGPSLGGFVCPVVICEAEMWKVGQLKPADSIRFIPIIQECALKLREYRENEINTLVSNSNISKIKSLTYEDIKPDQENISAAILFQLPSVEDRPKVIYRRAGDRYILIEYGEDILDLRLRFRVHFLMEIIKSKKDKTLKGVSELSPGVRSLQVKYDGKIISQNNLLQELINFEDKIPDLNNIQMPSRIIHLPLAFEDGATLGAVFRYSETVRKNAPWLPNNVDFIARINGITKDEVKDIIYNAKYMVLGLGDVYLGAPCAVPVNPLHRIFSSKYNPARTFTAEGTVGIGGMYMCIYGMDSPGGYQLVGRTLPIWNKFLQNKQFINDEPWLLKFFDQVKFYSVTEKELVQIREDFVRGLHEIKIENTIFKVSDYNKMLVENESKIEIFKHNQQRAFKKEVELWQGSDIIISTPEEIEEVKELEEIKGEKVYSDISGNVWKILVNSGDKVTKGDTIIILEAMKMEFNITASISGTINLILCKIGQIVSSGDIVVTIV